MTVGGVTISLPQYLVEVFDLPAALPVLQRFTPEPSFEKLKVKGYSSPAKKQSALGTYLYETLELYDEQGALRYVFPDTVLIEVCNRPKNIIRTPIQGRNGTVKELIGMDDWHLSIMGQLINPAAKDYPEDAVASMVSIYESNRSFGVGGSGLCAIGVHAIVMSDLKLTRRPGYPNSVAFKIDAYSDDPIELQILDS